MHYFLLRMVRWVRNPPSAKQVKFVLAILAVCLSLAIIERIYGWPEALTPSGGGRFLR